MRKTDKKIDNALREILTEVCDIALEEYDGFKWLTHLVNYNNFPESLAVVCIFDTNLQLKKADVGGLGKLIHLKLSSMGINITDISRHLTFDTEENCENKNNGNWNERLG